MSAFIIICMLLSIISTLYFAIGSKSSQQKYIEHVEFPGAIKQTLRAKYSSLSDEQCELVLANLREYFLICHMAKGQPVAMPSKAVDVAWHAFILHTREYKTFCKKAFGRFLHHTPISASTNSQDVDASLQRTWQYSCQRHFIDYSTPEKLPFLFALDEMLAIENGYCCSLDESPQAGKINVFSLTNRATSSQQPNVQTPHIISCGGYASS